MEAEPYVRLWRPGHNIGGLEGQALESIVESHQLAVVTR